METQTIKTALVTGATGGIGQEICKSLSERYNIMVHYHSNANAAAELVKELVSLGKQAKCVQADLSNESAIKEIFAETKREFGSIDAVVANAGASDFTTIAKSTSESVRKMIDINLMGSYLTIREAAIHVEKGGKIVFVSSQLAERPRQGTGIYSACKAAIDAMIVSMSHELGENKICINSVRPGATEPGMFESSSKERKEFFRSLSPFKRLGHPTDIAKAVSFLASEDANWITGQHLRVDGGASN